MSRWSWLFPKVTFCEHIGCPTLSLIHEKSKLVGLYYAQFFPSASQPTMVDRGGIVGNPAPGLFLVEFIDTTDAPGQPKVLLSLDQMKEGFFFDTATARDAYVQWLQEKHHGKR